MSARAGTITGAATLIGQTPRRPHSGQKVLRHSRHAGEREERAWAQHNRFADSEHNARMRALEAFEHATRTPGRRNGGVGHIGLEVMRFLLRRRCRKTGRLDFAHGYIAKALRRSVSAVREALGRLKMHGFLDWYRRTEPVDDPEPGGQVVRQIPNAYLLQLPPKMDELVRRMLRRPTEGARRAADQRDRADRLAKMSTEEVLELATDGELSATLKRLWSLVDRANPQ